MKFFKWRIISEYEYQNYELCYRIYQSAIRCRDWFSGWDDLDIIWNYVFGKRTFGGISEARADYARARGTTIYGEQK